MERQCKGNMLNYNSWHCITFHNAAARRGQPKTFYQITLVVKEARRQKRMNICILYIWNRNTHKNHPEYEMENFWIVLERRVPLNTEHTHTHQLLPPNRTPPITFGCFPQGEESTMLQT